MNKPYIIALDAGGTRLKVGVVDDDGQLIKTFHTPSNSNLGADILFEAIVLNVEQIRQEFGVGLAGIALSLSGVIHPDKGVVYLPGKFKMLEGYPIVEKLKTHFGAPVIADNDGRLAMYAEKYAGLAKDIDWAVCLTIGTGVGSGVLIDGRMLTNRFLQFGTQAGHVVSNSTSSKYCLTGNYGTGETLCSATALVMQVRGALQRGIPSLLSDAYFLNASQIDFEKVIDACRQGDTVCKREMDHWIEQLTILLVNTVHAYSPEMIILSGGATLAADLFLEQLRLKVQQQVFRYPLKEPVPILISNMQEYASVVGAALFLKNTLITQLQH